MMPKTILLIITSDMEPTIMNNDPVSEQELQAHAKQIGGRRVTPKDLEDAIAAEHYFTGADGKFGTMVMAQVPPEKKGAPVDTTALRCVTFCVLVLKNGFTVTGQSACADPAMFNEEIGKRVAREQAVSRLWPLLGYQLKEDMYREQQLLAGVAFTETEDFGTYISSKVVYAIPMTRGAYNKFRGWDLPVNEDGTDEGYLVEYTDRIENPPHVQGFQGYVSWSPKDVFERGYRAVGAGPSQSAAKASAQAAKGGEKPSPSLEPHTEDTFIGRMHREHAELDERLGKLETFLTSSKIDGLTADSRELLRSQAYHMGCYRSILRTRLAMLQV